MRHRQLLPQARSPVCPLAHPHYEMLSIFDRNKTFKPTRRGKAESANSRYEVHKLAHEVLKASLGAGDLRAAVKVPDGYEVNDWISVNVVDLFNQVNLIYGSMCDDCTARSCPVMCASPKYEYLWADNDRHKTPVKVSAPRYIELLMDWVDRQLSDEAIFPTIPGNKFPENFRSVVKTIMRRLFRVYAHICHSHLDEIVACGAEAHFNTCFRHFMYFGLEHNLLPSKELEPLKEVVATL
jgi:MOB kinase activator 1